MDALNLYIQASKKLLRDEIEEAMLNRMNIIGQNGNDGLHDEEEERIIKRKKDLLTVKKVTV